MKTRNILDYLFACIIINLIPVILLKVFEISSKLYTVLVLVAYATQTLLMCWLVRKKITETSKNLIIILITFFVLQIIAQLLSYFRWKNIEVQDIANILSLIINIFIFLYLCAKFEVTKKDFIAFMKKMVIVGLISCIYNIIVNWEYIINIFSVEYSYNVSISSFFPNRNQFGSFMLVMIISTLYILINQRDKKYIFLLLLFIINLILTMSRNAILGMGLVFIFFIIFNLKDFYKRLSQKQTIIICCIIAVLIIIGIVLLITIPEISDTIDRLFLRTSTGDLTSGRTKVWANGIEIWQNNPLIGVGRFQAININMTIYNSNLNQFHNVYIETLVSFGIVGLVGLVYIIFREIKKVKNSQIDKTSKRLMITSILVFLVISCFETTCRFAIGYVDALNMIFYFTIPLIYANIKGEKEEVGNEQSTKENEG